MIGLLLQGDDKPAGGISPSLSFSTLEKAVRNRDKL